MLAEAGTYFITRPRNYLQPLRIFLGKDATEAFEDVGHSDEAREILESLYVGDFEKGAVCLPTFSTSPPF